MFQKPLLNGRHIVDTFYYLLLNMFVIIFFFLHYEFSGV